ncbi:MAG TPA: hypothetical protein VFQ38_12305 [Longimicrobiales bacterium]|nr:hypothetical protein [Longimicrobiales bacterium]
MRTNPITGFLAAAALAALVACAPPPGSTEEPTPAPSAVKNAPFTLEVVNPMPHTMIVSYQWSGQEPTVLGPVEANATKRFTIPNRAADRITVVAQDEDHTHTVTKEVDLDKGEVTRVTLSQ